MAGSRVPALSPAALLPPQPAEALHARVARSLRHAVTQGHWPQGARLPGHRALAQQLGVSRNTLVDALGQLETEGYVTSRGRSGTRVCAPPGQTTSDAPGLLPLSAWARRALSGQDEDAGGSYEFDFRVGQPVPELYPEAAWTQALARRAGQHRAGAEALRDPLGPVETRRALAAYLNAERSARVTPDMVMLTGGIQSALDALARVFLEAGRVAASEVPTYSGAWAALAASGAEVIGVPVDAEGLDPAGLPEAATLVYLTPACQFPTTVTLPFARQRAVLDWAAACGAFVLEDDYAADLHHTGRPPAVMQGLAPERVILLGSFSKSLAPVTRSGFVVAPETVTRVLAGTRPLTDRVPGVLDSLALGDILVSGAYGRHLRRARQGLRHRYEVLSRALEAARPEWRLTPARAGLHLHAALPSGTEARTIVRKAADLGVAVTPVAGPHEAVLLAFAHLEVSRLREGAARLGRL
ncbi:PLP-dependent aminotransferase family protein [Deinococcus navajonensis]|uniref:PLP-dependent aminotransferase family protein n=1 Tax=Deinococcus navajonensis TaxID=309884 RepID=A0ABV8XKY8_9DEIO